MFGHTIEFVNRAWELEQICRPGAPRFTVVDGAVGYGKTYLLKEIKKVYETTRTGWKVALVDLQGDPQMTSKDSAVAWPCIANTVVQQFAPPEGTRPTVSAGADEASITDTLVPFLARQRANILLLFDGIEVLSRDTGNWLKRLINSLDQGLQRARRELRVVFAGRYVDDWGRGAPYAVSTLLLSPFDQVTVRDMVKQVTEAVEEQPTEDFLAELAWWTLHISGGHPRGICNVLEIIAKEGLIFANFEHVFLQRQFQRNGREGTLFVLCIKPIIDELLQGVSRLRSDLAEVMKILSPIRRFDGELLEELMKEGLIARSESRSSWDLVRDLQRTRLIKPPTAADPMFSDQIVRRMLAMQLKIEHPELFQRINKCALGIFDQWARSDSVGAEMRRVAIQESLYHTWQLEPDNSPVHAIQERLVEKLEDYLNQIQDIRVIFQLKDALNNDQELNDLITQRAGSAAVSALLDVIDRYLE